MITSKTKINETLGKRIKKTLVQALADLKDIKAIEKSLTDFLTESEYTNLAKRLAVAYWLTKGRSRANIKTNLKVTSEVISSVSQMMKREGFIKLIKNIEAEEWATVWSEKIKQFTNLTMDKKV